MLAETPRSSNVPLAPVAGGEKLLGSIPVNGEGGRGSLAERIRALQSRASQVPQPGTA